MLNTIRNLRLSRTCWLVLLVLLLTNVLACAHRPDTPDEQSVRTASLSHSLLALSPAITHEEASVFARTAVNTAALLRERYGVRLAPWLHNVEVNSGLRSRGLCFHYARDLADALKAVHAPHLQVHYVCANDDELLEHNAIVVTARGEPWSQGIVLDAWRHAGVLYFGPVTQDKYPWLPKYKKLAHER